MSAVPVNIYVVWKKTYRDGRICCHDSSLTSLRNLGGDRRRLSQLSVCISIPTGVAAQGMSFLHSPRYTFPVVIFRVAVSPAVEQLVERDFGQHHPKMVDSDHDVTSIRRSRVKVRLASLGNFCRKTW